MKQAKKKWLILTSLILVFVLVLSACGGGGSKGSDGKKGSGPVTITYYTIDSPDRTYVEKLIPDFESAHPNIKEKVEKAPYEQFDSKRQEILQPKMHLILPRISVMVVSRNTIIKICWRI